MLATAKDVWLFLKKKGGLKLDSYDREFPKELFEALTRSFPAPGSTSLDALLKTNAVPVEDFLVAFFKVVQPFADMMVDLLRFFEEANANEGKLNLRVKFDFGKSLPPLDFDLRHFRRWQETWHRVAGVFLVNLWNDNTLWALNGLLRSMDAMMHDTRMQEWLVSYYEGPHRYGHWPDIEPPAPKSGVDHLDVLFERVWQVWRTVVLQSKRYGRERQDLKRRRYSEDRNDPIRSETEAGQERWPVMLLAGLDSDHWAGTLAHGIYSKAEYIRGLSEPGRSAEAEAIGRELRALLDSVPSVQREGESVQRILEDFLNLPVWQRRYEIYSAWIATQIAAALRDFGVVIHSIDGQLLFEFKGTHLATIGTDPNLHLMAEIRSPLEKPLGFGRKKAMQPDYSLFRSPITSPKSSVLEIECKQYLVASKRKFAHALTDYANGRPNAQVALVNYGPASIDILNKVDANVRGRTHIIGLMRPRSVAAQASFARLVRSVAIDHLGRRPSQADVLPGSPATETPVVGKVTLQWGALPKDLDLHLEIVEAGHRYDVNFRNKGSLSGIPWAQLDQDVRDGTGCETIHIRQWLDGSYSVVVNNYDYSDDSKLAGSDATLIFMLGDKEMLFRCPAHGVGRWWEVFSYSPVAGKLEILNRLVPFRI